MSGNQNKTYALVSDKKLAELQQKILNFDFDKNLVKISEFDGIYVQKVPNVFEINIDEKETANA